MDKLEVSGVFTGYVAQFDVVSASGDVVDCIVLPVIGYTSEALVFDEEGVVLPVVRFAAETGYRLVEVRPEWG